MAIDHRKANRSATKLMKAVGSMHKAVPGVGKKPTLAQMRRLKALHTVIGAANLELGSALGVRLREVGGPEAPPTSSFDTFFSAVATSFAKAQRSLDERTREYLAGIQGRPELMPTSFRMSKVSADMKFAVDKVDTSSVGIIFYKDSSSTDVLNQQTVHFEMVAAPVPPGSGAIAPALPLLLSVVGRESVFKIVGSFNVAGDQTGSANLLSKPSRVLIYEQDSGRVVYLGCADDSNLGFWRLDLKTPKLTVMRAFGRASGDLDAARSSVLQLGIQQEAFLQSIG